MINKSIIKAVLNSATKENKDKVLSELLNHISLSYDYNDNKAGHILEMLVDNNLIISTEDVNIDYINKNLNLLMYNHEKYNIRNIKVDSVDNIDCNIKIAYEYLEKINEDRGDISYTSSYSNINFIDNPDILKK
jgi:hypothetical protein